MTSLKWSSSRWDLNGVFSNLILSLKIFFISPVQNLLLLFVIYDVLQGIKPVGRKPTCDIGRLRDTKCILYISITKFGSGPYQKNNTIGWSTKKLISYCSEPSIWRLNTFWVYKDIFLCLCFIFSFLFKILKIKSKVGELKMPKWSIFSYCKKINFFYN